MALGRMPWEEEGWAIVYEREREAWQSWRSAAGGNAAAGERTTRESGGTEAGRREAGAE
jgi:hypothetical protein